MQRPEVTVLQRLRFGELSAAEYRGDPFFSAGFDAARWQRAGRSCYWSRDESAAGVEYRPDGVRLAAGARLAADSYFNAFFAGHWHALTRVRRLSLCLRGHGAVRVRVTGHAALGGADPLVEGDAVLSTDQHSEFGLPAPALEGRYLRLSFSVQALAEPAVVTGGEWITPDVPDSPVAVDVVTPTYNRPHFARRTVNSLLLDADVANLIQRIILIEQSEKPELGDLDGGKCTWVHQPNYGCAGGCARGFFEVLQEPAGRQATHVLLLDDDIMMEPDSVLRVARLAQFATSDMMLGGGMLDLFQPNRIVALGENLERNDAGFHAITQVYPNADVGHDRTLDFAALPRKEGYCAWWFCCFPRTLAEKIGLPWPGFLRWDDINYGVRAAQAGYPSYLVPGVGVWHVPFYSKSAAWTTYFDKYNELIENALLDAAAVDRYLAHVIEEARAALQRNAWGSAAAFTLAADHYLDGWRHYASRTFPGFLGEVKGFIQSHDRTGARAAIEQRLYLLELRRALGPTRAHEEFAREMPVTYSVESWRRYFERGNLLGAPIVAGDGASSASICPMGVVAPELL